MGDMKQVKEEQNINLPADIAEGIFSNLVLISHSQSEFVFDFVRLMPNMKTANVKSRIIVTPDHAKRILSAMAENIERYEKEYGEIKVISQRPNIEMPQGFNGPKGEA